VLDRQITVKVSALDGSRWTLEISGEVHVGELKAKLECLTGVPAREEQLLWREEILEDSSTMACFAGASNCVSLTLVRVARHRVVALGGGTIARLSAEFYDSASGLWSALPGMLTPRHGLAAASCGHQVFAIGGEDCLGRVLSSVECFDVTTLVWSEAPGMSTGRYTHAATSITGQLFVVGGQDEVGSTLGCGEAFDIEAGTWSRLPELNTPRHSHALVAVNNRELLVFGGIGDGARALGSGEVLNLEGGSRVWALLPDMRVPRYSLAAVVWEGLVYVLGGKDDDGRAQVIVEAFDYPAGSWFEIAAMSVARHALAAVSTETGIYVLGGRSTDHDALASVEVYSTESCWVTASRMGSARSGLAGAVVC